MQWTLVSEATLIVPKPQANRSLTAKVFGILMIGALIGAVGVLPYALALAWPSLPSGSPPLALLLVLQVVQLLIVAAVAVAIGLWLGPKIGLGAPLIRDWLAGDTEAPARYRATVVPSIVAGVLASVAIVVLDGLVFSRLLAASVSQANATRTAPWQGFLASFYGGIDEELLLRFGLMTLLVFIGARLAGQGRPTSAIVWTGNLLAAILFGLGHLPATAAILPLTPIVVVRAIVLNGLAGVVFGWIFWRRGILSAMTAHFSGDLVLHVLLPFLTP